MTTDREAIRATALDWIEANRARLSAFNARIWAHAEPAWREYNSCADYVALLREEGSGTRVLMERFLARLGGRPPDVVEMGTNETIKQSVLAGLGIAIISAHTCMAELKDGRLAALSYVGLPLVRQWFLLHRRDRELTMAARHFLDHAKQGRDDFFPRVPSH